jgi:hypothetical protein
MKSDIFFHQIKLEEVEVKLDTIRLHLNFLAYSCLIKYNSAENTEDHHYYDELRRFYFPLSLHDVIKSIDEVWSLE